MYHTLATKPSAHGDDYIMPLVKLAEGVLLVVVRTYPKNGGCKASGRRRALRHHENAFVSDVGKELTALHLAARWSSRKQAPAEGGHTLERFNVFHQEKQHVSEIQAWETRLFLIHPEGNNASYDTLHLFGFHVDPSEGEVR